MEQRPLRLGDIVDDYCPRERRITNHAIVAIVENAIRQTRCSTCDAEHVYKAAKVPRRRKKDEPSALYEQVLAEAAGAAAPEVTGPELEAADAVPSADADEAPPPSPEDIQPDADDAGMAVDARGEEAWSGHRPLIRATLPRQEGEPPPQRPIPEFTMHQRPGRGFRSAWQGNGFSRNGSRPDRSGPGGHGRPGHGSSRRRHGRKKHSR